MGLRRKILSWCNKGDTTKSKPDVADTSKFFCLWALECDRWFSVHKCQSACGRPVVKLVFGDTASAKRAELPLFFRKIKKRDDLLVVAGGSDVSTCNNFSLKGTLTECIDSNGQIYLMPDNLAIIPH